MVTLAPLLLFAFALHAQDAAAPAAKDAAKDTATPAAKDPAKDAAKPAAKEAAQDADFFTIGKDHAQFARGLYSAGYKDLAEIFCTRVENSPNAKPEEVSSVRSVHLDLKIEAAKGLKDHKAKLAELSTLLKAKEEFIDAYPGTPEATEAQLTMPDVYAALGEAYADAVSDVKDQPSEAKRLRSEGNDIFRRGESALGDQIEQIEAAAADTSLSEPAAEKLDYERLTAKYNLARTLYFHAALLGKDDPFGKTFYERAAEAFGELQLEYGDRLEAYEGQVLMGMAFQALGQTDDALDAFDACIALKDTFGPDEPMPPSTIQVIAWGTQEKIQLLTELKRFDDAIKTADDFVKTVKGADAPGVQQDLVVLLARMEAEVAKGDSVAANKTAQILDQRSPNSYFGARGREILGNLAVGGGASIDTKNLLKIAQSQAAKGDYEQAIVLANKAVAATRTAAKPGDEITDVFMLIGNCDWRLERFDEAAVAYDAAYDGNPAAAKAGDALYSASAAYDKLYNTTRQGFYEKRSDERLTELAQKFPKHPKAAARVLSEAKKLEANDQWADAAAAYLRVTADSAAYPDAQYGAATTLYKDASRLSKEKSPDVKAAATKAEAQLKKAQGVLEAAAGKTLDLDEKTRLEASAFETVKLTGSLYMLDGVGRQNDVLALTDEIEKKYAGDEAKIGEARSLRVRALTALGKVKEAEDFLEGLLAGDPNSKSTALAAGVLARTFDQQVSELRAKDPKSTAADDLWKQAFRYYVISTRPKLAEGRASDELEQVGRRMLIMGEHFNGVPDGVTSFVGLKSGKKPVAPEYWEEAAKVFEAAAASGNFNAKVGQARTLGYLGSFKEASDVYSEIVENESLVDPSTNDINRSALTSRPELLGIYLESGVAKFELGKQDAEVRDQSLGDASAIFQRIVKAAPKMQSESWWRARYYQLASWYETGLYKQCVAAINDLERNSDNFDEAKWKLGLAERFTELKREAERKVR